ncbi:hypothetical protein GCM10028806_32490 [Spirosoma terrae]|uniref:Outer membrane beta-barrel protein n=1 Tax=Spirosoma terrae TaxID=1968276 RepID=A0A6L9L9U0_9BACT|nr:DUF6089 family protein [Spirosoma terrae]NDU95563.1 outer membrane beta-barrel protein [Spirosoma terrae]
MKRYHYLAASILTGISLLSNTSDSKAQRRPNTNFVPYSSVSFGVGSSHYYGDLAGYRQFIRATYIMPRWNLGLGYTRQFTPHFAARAMFTWARIAGDDYTFNKNNIEKNLVQYARNLHFRNDLKEFAVSGIYNFVADGRNSNVRAKLTPYLFGGVALLAHSPEARTPVAEEAAPYEAQKWVKLQPLHTEGQGQPGYDKPYSLVTVAIPVGIGLRYRLNENFNLGFELGYRYTFTDYLDDVGGPYADPSVLQGLATKMADRRTQHYDSRYKNPVERYQVLVDLYNNPSTSPELKQQISDALQTNAVPRGSASNILGFLNDGYVLTSFQIHYIIPTKIKCPPIR